MEKVLSLDIEKKQREREKKMNKGIIKGGLRGRYEILSPDCTIDQVIGIKLTSYDVRVGILLSLEGSGSDKKVTVMDVDSGEIMSDLLPMFEVV